MTAPAHNKTKNETAIAAAASTRLCNMVLMDSPPSLSVQELDGFARHAQLGDIIAHRGFDFEPAVASGNLELPRRAEKAVAQDLRGEDILAGRPVFGACDLDAFGADQYAQRTAGGTAVRRRDQAADRRVDGLRVDHPRVEQIGAADEAGDEGVGRPIRVFVGRTRLTEPP